MARHHKLESGLRTTLIVVVATEVGFHYGYIGDGSIHHVRRDGNERALLNPQRLEGGPSNVLAASLGPVTSGEPEFGRYGREPGDFLFIATDGVADRVKGSFYKACLRQFLLSNGDTSKALDLTLETLSTHRDAETSAVVFDDNMTLGVIADGHRPLFREGFWREESLAFYGE